VVPKRGDGQAIWNQRKLAGTERGTEQKGVRTQKSLKPSFVERSKKAKIFRTFICRKQKESRNLSNLHLYTVALIKKKHKTKKTNKQTNKH
jgi:hypothetical protein